MFWALHGRLPLTSAGASTESTDGQLGAVFIHGFGSSSSVWDPFLELIQSDADLGFVTPLPFDYATSLMSLNPLRRIPTFETIADDLKGFLETEGEDFPDLALVSHSQGGHPSQPHRPVPLQLIAEGPACGGRESSRCRSRAADRHRDGPHERVQRCRIAENASRGGRGAGSESATRPRPRRPGRPHRPVLLQLIVEGTSESGRGPGLLCRRAAMCRRGRPHRRPHVRDRIGGCTAGCRRRSGRSRSFPAPPGPDSRCVGAL
ncbi:alpha/beta fold hydrolase [Streptomyces sp. 5.8]|uniref:alpha/beta fold hydrolase n=1 Tax=Streptomyces sp. 5.8 TaxID=3406571 RepID=UPI003BB6834D